MTTNGLFLMAVGFYIIMLSGRNQKVGTGLDVYLLTLGVFFVGLGFYFFRRGKKRDKAKKADAEQSTDQHKLQQVNTKKGTKK